MKCLAAGIAAFSISFSGQGLAAQGTAGGLARNAAWVVDGPAEYGEFGTSVASAGDVNGDGYGDVIVGAYRLTRDQDSEGVAFLYLGSAAGLATTPAWSAEGDQEYSTFAYSVASAGDVDGDGYGDVLVGGYYWSPPGLYLAGRAFLYRGSAAGLAISPSWTADGEGVNHAFGYDVASAGDVNGDGFGDVIVGALQATNGHREEGRAYLYLGSASGLAKSPAWIAESNRAAANFGGSVASAGDVDADGYSDVLVGALYMTSGERQEGRAYLYLGSAAGLAPAPAWTAEGNQAGAGFGYVASAGDVNGDGFSDAIVGAAGASRGQDGEGRAFLFLGSASGLAATPAWSGESNQYNAFYGGPVASAGDVNGDGYSDVLVGASNFANGNIGEGRAFAYLGSASGLEALPSWTAEGNQKQAHFGFSLASAGDVNGDGYSDAIVGAIAFGEENEGRGFVYLGNEGRPGVVRAIQQRTKSDSRPIALLGRLGPDGLFRIQAELAPDAITPGSLAHLEWEVKPLGESFDGTVVERGADQPLRAGEASLFNELVDVGFSSPLQNASFHWRARIATSDPLLPHTLWFSQPGNNITEAKLRKPKLGKK